MSDSSKQVKIAVIDKANLFNGKMEKAKDDPSNYEFLNSAEEQAFKADYKKKGYDYFLYIPQIDIKNPVGIRIHSESAISLGQKSKIENTVDRAIEVKRLQEENISPAQYKAIKSNVTIDNPIGKEGKKSVAGVALVVSFACGILIYMILMIYGTMVMRGVMEEKVNRIAEVIVSSVKPFQLMLGKILGIGAVGITQFVIWIVLIMGLRLLFPMLGLGMGDSAAGTAAQSGAGGMLQTFANGMDTINIPLNIFCFLFYFAGGYMLYASLFAAIGSVVSEDQQEAQQLVFPVMMPIILAFVIMTKAVSDPNSGIAVFGSLFPLTSPIVMMGRINYDVPAWQLITSMVLLVLGFLFFTWLTAKIYRTGILLYGKRVTWKEMIKWTFRKA